MLSFSADKAVIQTHCIKGTLTVIDMLSFLALFPSPLLSKPRGAEPGNEASYSTDVPNTSCANTERYLLYYCLTSFQYRTRLTCFLHTRMSQCWTGILQCIVLPHFDTGQTHLTYADRYIVVCCFIFLLLQIKRPIFTLFTSLIISPTD